MALKKKYRAFLTIGLLLGLAAAFSACGEESSQPAAQSLPATERPSASPSAEVTDGPSPTFAQREAEKASPGPYMGDEEADRWEEDIQALPDYPSNFDDDPEGAEDYEAAKIREDMESEGEDD